MAIYQYLDNQATTNDGTILGQSSSSKISFWGTTPAARVADATQATITATWVTISSGFGFQTSDQIVSVIAQLKMIAHVLKTAGIWKGSA